MKRLENQCPCCLKLSTKSRTMAKLAQADKFKQVEEAMKQHAALLAVAEVMRRQTQGHGRNYSGGKCPCAACQALATLAQIQKGE